MRELISNSSDALDKIKFESLKNKDKNLLESNPEFYVHIIPDKTNNTLTIIDSGIGAVSILSVNSEAPNFNYANCVLRIFASKRSCQNHHCALFLIIIFNIIFCNAWIVWLEMGCTF